MVRLNIRITLFLVRAAGMGDRAIHRRPHLLGAFHPVLQFPVQILFHLQILEDCFDDQVCVGDTIAGNVGVQPGRRCRAFAGITQLLVE